MDFSQYRKKVLSDFLLEGYFIKFEYNGKKFWCKFIADYLDSFGEEFLLNFKILRFLESKINSILIQRLHWIQSITFDLNYLNALRTDFYRPLPRNFQKLRTIWDFPTPYAGISFLKIEYKRHLNSPRLTNIISKNLDLPALPELNL